MSLISFQQALAEYRAEQATIDGHPSVEAHRPGAAPLQITVCADCGALSSVLWLSVDRWYCGKCRSSGDGRPTQVSMNSIRGKN